LVDVDESWAAAEFGPHDRREATLPLHSEGTPYGPHGRRRRLPHRGRAAGRG
jgi:hypothetical protein